MMENYLIISRLWKYFVGKLVLWIITAVEPTCNRDDAERRPTQEEICSSWKSLSRYLLVSDKI